MEILTHYHWMQAGAPRSPSSSQYWKCLEAALYLTACLCTGCPQLFQLGIPSLCSRVVPNYNKKNHIVKPSSKKTSSDHFNKNSFGNPLHCELHKKFLQFRSSMAWCFLAIYEVSDNNTLYQYSEITRLWLQYSKIFKKKKSKILRLNGSFCLNQFPYQCHVELMLFSH